MTYRTDNVSRFRALGSRGLVVFERDGILLRTKRLSEDLVLKDLNHALIGLLRRFRSRGIRFGFLCNDRGMDADSAGWVASLALMDLIDAILRVNDAEPDFWMAMPFSKPTRNPNARKARDDARSSFMLLRAIEWYGMEKSQVVLVGNSRACRMLAGADGMTALEYSASTSQADESRSADLLEIERIENVVKTALGL